jgi:hypothetical protein
LLDQDTRKAIFRLRRSGHGFRTIARALGLTRNTVRQVLRSGRADVSGIERATELDPHLDLVRQLYVGCGGNLVRVFEELGPCGFEGNRPCRSRGDRSSRPEGPARRAGR